MAEPNGQQDEVEVVTPAGKFKARGSDILGILTLVGVSVLSYIAFKHDASAAKDNSEVAQALKESNKEIAIVLREQNKESNVILRELARATRESNCLLAMQPERRAQMAETCKRLSQ